MLELRGITKSYTTASLTQTALDSVTLSFRDNEFVAILGQSGSGKTTMLNVIGGLDRFDSGDLAIDSVSTQQYKARDWDTYRNNRIGFVFQAYNLIPHQSVLANVELALTLSGVGRRERRERALAALTEVGLGDHVHKRPGQLSGGQMQRVAIARALVNDPEILLADEPTGALDSATSIQVMDLLKQVARDRLVIMVTHNPELAHAYATRIVELADGRVVADSDPFDPTIEDRREARPQRRTAMSFGTALSLSFANLMTKKGRTVMTSLAGSIGIIGIAAILALATGVNAYIARTEEELLTSYPLSIQRSGMDMGAILASVSGATPAAVASEAPDDSEVTRSGALEDALDAVTTNDLESLRSFLESGGGGIDEHVRAIEYRYDVTPQIYLPDTSNGVLQVNPSTLGDDLNLPESLSMFQANLRTNSFSQLPATPEIYTSAYDVKAGRWPEAADELVLVLPADGQLLDVYEFNMGLRDRAELSQMVTEATTKTGGQSETVTGATGAGYSYEQLMAVEFRLVDIGDTYSHDAERNVWTSRADEAAWMEGLVAEGQRLRIVGIAQVKQDEDAPPLSSALYYTHQLTEQVIDRAAQSEIVRDQQSRPEVNVFTGKTFAEEAEQSDPMASFDLESLFTIDQEKITAAFKFDESALTNAMSGLDLSGMDLSGLQSAPLEMPALDLSTLDPGQLSLDLSGLDASALDAAALQEQFPQLAEVDWATVLNSSLDGVLKEGGQDALAATAQELLAGFVAYQAEQAASGKDAATLAVEYFTGAEASAAIGATLGSGEVIDQERLTANLVAALGEDPAIAGVVAAVQGQLVQAISAQVASAVQSMLTQALGTQLQNAMAASMTQLMTALQGQIAAQIESAMGRMTEAMGSAMSIDEEAFAEAFQFNVDADELASMMTTMLNARGSSLETNLSTLNWAELDDPSKIDIYPKSFQDKDEVKQILQAYNADAEAAGQESKVITYSDLVGALMTSVTDIVDMISAMLIAFVAISLVVSSIMIGIITYISVLERKKEIGILRSIGASKGDIRSVFNAETVLVGLFAGLLGVGITYLLTIPANVIVEQTLKVSGIAQLPVGAAAVLVGISVLLTLFAGLLPAGKAAKSDPVEALRSE